MTIPEALEVIRGELFGAGTMSRGYMARVDAMKVVQPILEAAGKTVCLCGSTRFTNEMLIAQWEFTKAGQIVLSWCALPDFYFEGEDKAHIGDQEGVKEIVDEVHKRKIDLCDSIFVINVGGYVGDSTKSEILYAIAHGKRVRWLEPDSADAILAALPEPEKEK